MIITKKDMSREVVKDNFIIKLDTPIIETIAMIVRNSSELNDLNIKDAVGFVVNSMSTSDDSFHEELIPMYEENYNLIGLVGMKGMFKLTLEEFIINEVMSCCVDTIGLMLAKDYLYVTAKDDAKYDDMILKFVDTMIPSAYETIADMLADIDFGLEISEIDEVEAPKQKACCGKGCCGKDKDISPEIHVIVLDSANADLDMLSILKILNGEK